MAVETKSEESRNGQATMLRPEAMGKAKDVQVDPVVREQGLPEKDDHRFMDRWTLDWARDLGERVVRRLGLKRLQEGTEGFGEWRALGHEVRRRQEDTEDKVEIATSDSRVTTEAEHVEIFEAREKLEEDRADGYEIKAKAAEETRTGLTPAMRGGRADVYLLVAASAVLFAVDILILHQAFGLLTGADWEHWGTAGLIGAGVVVIGEVVGWALAAAMVRERGTFKAPAEKVAIAISLVVLLTVLFFVSLGIFRADSLDQLAELDKVPVASPGFFTLAQILFFIGAAACCFSYIARADGRLLLAQLKEALEKEKDHRRKAADNRVKADQARREVGQAPIRRQAAEARLASREKVAEAQAKRDRQQARYLKPLLEAEYLSRRAEVESGLRYWTFVRSQVTLRLRSLAWILHPGLTFALLTAVVAYIAMDSVAIAGTAGFSVLLAIWIGRLVSGGTHESAPASEAKVSEEAYVADVRSAPLPQESDQATEIERLVRRRQGDRNGDSESAAGHGADPGR